MHTRYSFVVIFSLALISFNLSALHLVESRNTTPPIAHEVLLRVPKSIQQERRILNGHFNCTDPYELLKLGADNYQKNKFDKARIFWEHVVNQPQEDQSAIAIAWYNLGHAYYELNQPEKTEIAWEQAAQQEDEFFIKADALFNLSVLLDLQGKQAKAQKKYETLKKMLFNAQPRDDEPFHEAEALYYLAIVCANNNQYDEAVKYHNMTLLLLERIGWLNTDVTTQVQAFKYLAQLAKAEGDDKIAQGYQKNITFLLNPPSIEDTKETVN